MNKARIRVCIIEDHSIVLAGLKVLLASEPDIEIVGAARDRKTALDVARQTSPDLFLIDLNLGQESALDFIEELIGDSDARSIILTGAVADEDIHRAIMAGVMGLVFKDEGAEVLVRAIRKVHTGEAWLSRPLMTAAISRLRASRRPKKTADPEASKIDSLTRREREIIKLLANGMNRQRIVESLNVSEGTLKNHLTAIFGKLEVYSQLELVFYAQRHNLDK